MLTAFEAAFAGKKAPKVAETIDLPPTFDVDYQFVAKQREQLGPQREVPDDIAGRRFCNNCGGGPARSANSARENPEQSRIVTDD